ncbi:MAG: rhombosortase [Verrucomicrobia bacterium]|nr:rhombosortase [Verrucomicrobiota bacterium]
MQSTIANSFAPPETTRHSSARKFDLWIFIVLLAGLNIPLLSGGWNHAFTFLPGAVGAGEWWRLLTFPFVHVNLYHLLIDGIAFALLYSSLSEKSASKRLCIFCASAVGSLLVSLWTDVEVQKVGLCGLSGVAHGLMAVCALEMFTAREKAARTFAYISFGILFLKCALEAITGRLIFDMVHLGSVGVPIVVCHAGGMLGALGAVLVMKPLRAGLKMGGMGCYITIEPFERPKSRPQVAADNGMEKQNCRVDLPLCGRARSTHFRQTLRRTPDGSVRNSSN